MRALTSRMAVLLVATKLEDPFCRYSWLVEFKARLKADFSPESRKKTISLLTISFLLISIFLTIPNNTFASSIGPNSPSVGTSAAGANTAWTNPGNVTTSNSIYATASIASTASSNNLTATGFGFSINTAAVINGVTVEVQKFASNTTKQEMRDSVVSLVIGGTVTGSNYATATAWPTSNTFVTYGGSTNMWGTSVTATQINAANFGVAFAATNAHLSGASSALTANVDYIRVTVDYTLNSSFTQASYRLFGNQDSTGQRTFVKTWGGATADQSRKMVATSDGGYAITGYTSSFGAGGLDLLLNKYNSAGDIVFSKTWGGTGDEYGMSIVQTSDGGYAVTGYTSSNGSGIVNAGLQDMMLLKFDSNGALTWQAVWGGANYDQGISVVQTSDGGYAVTGQSNSFGANGYEFILVKYTSAGSVSFSKTWGGTGIDVGQAIVQTTDGGYAISGYTTSSISAGGYDSVIIKLDSTGAVTNQKTWGGSVDDLAFTIIQTADGGYVIAGQEASYGGQGIDNFFVKYDSTLTVQFAKNWGGAGTDYVYQVVEASDGSLVMSGRANNLNGSSGDDMSLTKFTGAGVLSIFNVFGGTSNEIGGNSIALTADGGYALAGETTSSGAGSDDITLVKYDSNGNISGCGSLCASPSVTAASITATVSTPAISSVTVSPTTSTPTLLLDTASATVGDYVRNGAPIDVGSPLAALNTAGTTPGDGQPFRLRMDINIGTSDMTANGQLLKLQYAALSGGSCSATPTGNYSDVTNTSTVGYYDNTNAYSSIALTTNANDPTDGANTLTRQSYLENGTTAFSNPTTITNGNDGMWDFGLTTSNAVANTHYCLRITSSTGTVLNSYTNYPEIIIPPYSISQSSYRFYNNGGVSLKTFAKAYGGSGREDAYTMIKTSDGGMITAGSTTSYGDTTNGDTMISKYDVDGVLSWSKTWGSSIADEYFYQVVETSDGGFAAAGYTWSVGAGSTDAIIVKYTSTGTVSWARTLGTTGADYGRSLIQSSDGGYVIVGYEYFTESTNGDAFIAKLDSAGSLSWIRKWGGANADQAYDVTEASDGGYVMTGQTYSYGDTTYGDAYIAKYTSTGTLSWSKTWGGSLTETAQSIITTADNGYAITGQTDSYNDSSTDVFVAKFDSTGALSWSNTWGGVGSSDYSEDLRQTSDGNYIIAGATYSYGNGGMDTFLTKLSSSGALTWARTFGKSGSTGAERFYAVTETSDGGYAATGITSTDGAGGYDNLIVKYDTGGTLQNCGTYCTSPTPTVTTPSVTLGSPSASSASYAATSSAQTLTVTSPSPTTTVIVSLAGGVSIGSPLAAQNTAPTAPSTGTPFRLRFLLGTDTTAIPINGQSLKLQYASKSGTCATTSGFSDLSGGSGVIRFYANTGATDGAPFTSTANDPTDGARTVVTQAYRESNPFNNSAAAIPAGQDGEWDFSLINNSAVTGSLCFRVVKADNSLLDTYTFFPELFITGSNAAPSSPSLLTPTSGTTSVSVSPSFSLRSSDANNDYLRYKILLYQSNCTTLIGTYDQTSSQTGWFGQDANANSAYAGSSTITSSTSASYVFQGALSNSTTYCWKAAAIDPAGTNTWSVFSATQNFTTSAVGPNSPIILKGGTDIRGGTRFGN